MESKFTSLQLLQFPQTQIFLLRISTFSSHSAENAQQLAYLLLFNVGRVINVVVRKPLAFELFADLGRLLLRVRVRVRVCVCDLFCGVVEV